MFQRSFSIHFTGCAGILEPNKVILVALRIRTVKKGQNITKNYAR